MLVSLANNICYSMMQINLKYFSFLVIYRLARECSCHESLSLALFTCESLAYLPVEPSFFPLPSFSIELWFDHFFPLFFVFSFILAIHFFWRCKVLIKETEENNISGVFLVKFQLIPQISKIASLFYSFGNDVKASEVLISSDSSPPTVLLL